MNIVILTDRYAPTPVSCAILNQDLALELNSQGHQVFVLAGDSNIEVDFEFKKDNRINVLKVRVPNQKRLSLPRRLLFELFLQKKIWKVFRKTLTELNIDLVIAHSPTIFWGFLLNKINSYNNPTTYLVLRDIFPKWAVDTRIISTLNPVYWLLRWHEKKLYKEVDIIGVQSESNLDYFQENTFKGSFGTEVLFNWKKIGPNNHTVWNLREKYDLQNKIIFVFGGNIGFAQDMDNLLRLVSSFKNTDKIHFLFIGEGTEYERIKVWIKDNRFETKLTLLPAVPYEEYQDILRECDVGLISLRKDFKTDNFPNKILNFMEYRLPVLASINSGNELQSLIEAYNSGLVCDNGEDEVFFNYAKKLLNNKSIRKDMGENGYKFLKAKFNVKHIAQQIVNHAKNTRN